MKSLEEWLAPLKASYEHNTDYAKGAAYKVLAINESANWIELSSNSNGYIREIAIAMLQEELSKQTIRAVLVALNDWVANVRNQAQEVLDNYLSQDCAHQLLANVDILLALTRRNRTNHQLTLDRIKAYLQQPAYKTVLAHAFLDNRGRYALFVFELLLKVAPSLAAEASMEHKDTFVRYVVVKYHRRFTEPVADLLLTRASNDKNGRVRVAALRVLYPKLTNQQQRLTILKAALLHPSGALRGWAMWAAKDEEISIMDIVNEGYQHILPSKHNWLGLLGVISDNHLVAALTIVKEALKSPIQKIRAKALICYGTLDADNFYQVLIFMLQDESAKIFAYCAKLLAEKYRPEGLHILLESAKALAVKQQDERLLLLMEFVPDWQNLQLTLDIADLISIKTRDKLLKSWCRQYPHLIYLPKLSSELKADIVNKLTLLRKVDPKLKDKIASNIA